MVNAAQQDSMETHTTLLQMEFNGSNTTGVLPGDGTYHLWSFAFSVILAAVLSISAFLAVVGNSMVLTVIIRHRGMRTRTNLFLVNLAVADLLVGAAVEPFTITTLIEGRWVFGSPTGTFCKINGWLNCFCLVASIHTLMYISIHKYVSITKPLGNHFKLRQILGMMAAAWVWAAVSSTITVTGLSSVRYKIGTSQCGPEYPSGLKSYIFHIIIQVTNIFIPLIILTFCYTRMFREIRAHSRRLQENSTLEQDIILAQQKRVTITLFIVLACFIICALPYHLYATYTTISINKKFSPYINPVAYSFLYLNSACNPIIYAFRSPAFREGYKEILCQTPTYILSDGIRPAPVPPVAGSPTCKARALGSGIRQWPPHDTQPYKQALHRLAFHQQTVKHHATADEAQSPLWHRLSSFFSLRRTSTMSTMVKDQHRSSVCSMNSLVCQGSPVQTVPSGRKQKSISGLIRATRRSTRHSSIIRRNGNIIIVKGGKIVSVRRQESFQASIPVENGLAAETTDSEPKANGCTNHITSDLSSESLQGQDSAVWKRRSCSSEGSDSVFDDRYSSLACSSDFACDSPLEMISEEKKLLSQTSDAEQECESSLSTNEVCAPAVKASQVNDKSLPGEGVSCYPSRFKTDVGIIINIDEDDSILDIMPLTPCTRDHIIARSDLFLDDGAKAFEGSLTKLKPAHSSQALSKRSLRRLPSVEYLDPPIGLRKSNSDNNVHSSTKLQQNVRTLKIPTPNPKRWSFGRIFDKKHAENI